MKCSNDRVLVEIKTIVSIWGSCYIFLPMCPPPLLWYFAVDDLFLQRQGLVQKQVVKDGRKAYRQQPVLISPL